MGVHYTANEYATNAKPKLIVTILFMPAVLYTQDWQGTFWYSMKPTAMILTKSSSCVDNMAVLANIKTVFNCILVLIKALLDAIASVAASVIFSRLLISGDIESNPGPGESYYH